VTAVFEDVVQRLASFGYTVDETVDTWVLNFCIDKVTNTILNLCNIDSIPDGLHQIAVDMVCGEFLSGKKGSGQLDGIDAAGAIKSIKEGDTQITYAVSDDSITLDSLIDMLLNRGKSEFVRYRRLVW
jgi:hypothetical protein